MDYSPGSAERRANLIREMARHPDRNHTRASNLSSNSSANGDQNAYDTKSRQIPPVRLNQDYQFNSSAIKRAFPDFSQGSTSDEDSIEMGRGLDKPTANNDAQSEDITEDMPFTFGNGAKYRITATPPIKPKKANIKSKSVPKLVDQEKDFNLFDGEDKENQPNAARKMTDLNATVESIDSPFVANQRPANADGGKRTSRSDSRRNKSSKQTEQAPPQNNLTNTSILSAVNGTHQSFVLPDMPNITELISGVRQDGTPLFSRSAKARSRFTTPQNRRGTATKQAHIPIQDAPAGVDEKALYVSLQVLQEKVTALEVEKEQREKKLDEYELEVLQLRSKLEALEHRRNSDSGLGTDPEEIPLDGTQNEKSKLEDDIKTLQDRLERANRKASKSELTIQSLHNDRDAAHHQLAVAFLNSEELKTEGKAMRDEITRIKEEISRLNRNHERKVVQLSNQESELRGKIERREKAINEMSSLVKELWKTRKALAETVQDERQSRKSEYPPSEPLQMKKTRASTGNQLNEVKDSVTRPSEESRPRTAPSNKAGSIDQGRPRNLSRSRGDHGSRTTNANASDGESTTNIRFESLSFRAEELSKNETYLSFMEGDEVAKLRNIVNEDKQKLAQTSDDKTGPANMKMETKPLPRKSSLKRVSYPNVQGGHIRDDDTLDNATRMSKMNAASNGYIEPSLTSQSTAVRRRTSLLEQPEMTSAIILPDITLSGHFGIGASAKQTMSIPRPVPVSDRHFEVGESEEDMTVRPAQSPAIALATVLKGLEDELDQLRSEVARLEALYNQHDPALSKRKRKIVYAKIQKLLAASEIRADQIYALYDVLEGQKASGQTMNEEEVEITLQHIGIDPDVLRLHRDVDSRKRTKGVSQPDEEVEEGGHASDGEESEELPWEGFEPTQTNTLDTIGRFRAG